MHRLYSKYDGRRRRFTKNQIFDTLVLPLHFNAGSSMFSRCGSAILLGVMAGCAATPPSPATSATSTPPPAKVPAMRIEPDSASVVEGLHRKVVTVSVPTGYKLISLATLSHLGEPEKVTCLESIPATGVESIRVWGSVFHPPQPSPDSDTLQFAWGIDGFESPAMKCPAEGVIVHGTGVVWSEGMPTKFAFGGLNIQASRLEKDVPVPPYQWDLDLQLRLEPLSDKDLQRDALQQVARDPKLFLPKP
ncbi:MAG TPA: hypothetical protein VK968_05850 [Roseimicrobium sp.]|nr:hypothetical protein [Roseimicrobium sp.]